ncbi:unnamed protein product [Sphagnum jensenii]|uniref:Uncharacterized protein n=1 Tax=Sphagnum jensenii TaxID=128206 RepID=A0ABP0WMJ3_9BRYO
MHVGERESICGWVASQRSHGSVTFVNLRDHTGIVQVTTDPINFADTHKTAERLHIECVVVVEGTVHLHPKEVVNAWMATGLVEMSTNLRLHHSMIRLIQRYLEDVLYFVQIETPILTRSTPEGAHDYLVPSYVQGTSMHCPKVLSCLSRCLWCQVLADTTNWHSILLLTSA